MEPITFLVIAAVSIVVIFFASRPKKKEEKKSAYSGYSSYDPRPYYSGAPVDDARPHRFEFSPVVAPPVYDAAYYSPALDSSPSYDSGSSSSDSSSSCDSGSSSVSCD